MVEITIDGLNKLRKKLEQIITCMEQNHDSDSVIWQQPRVRRRRRMDGENAEDEPVETPEDHWKRNTIYVSVDTVLNSFKNLFEKNRPFLLAFSLFVPSRFPELVMNFKTAHDLHACLNSFCETYNIDAFRCADKFFNFARSFEKFNYSTVSEVQDDDDYDDDEKDDDDVSSTSAKEQSDCSTTKAKKQLKKKVPSFSEALSLLCNPDYSLVDAYPTLCCIYAIAVAIQVSSSTAERSFSALKRVKTRICSSMVQERLEALLSMTIERKILLKCDKERLINLCAGLSPVQSLVL